MGHAPRGPVATPHHQVGSMRVILTREGNPRLLALAGWRDQVRRCSLPTAR
ncbi:hypothetical protein TI01_0799 [Lysobacter sp. A03]|nr:hypothetical protein TI01_0799 [Lysobacter sp. A03]